MDQFLQGFGRCTHDRLLRAGRFIPRVYHKCRRYGEQSSGAGRENKVRPNGLRFTRAAPLDRESRRAETRLQNRPDLVAAKRRRVEALVGRRRGMDVVDERADGVTALPAEPYRSFHVDTE